MAFLTLLLVVTQAVSVGVVDEPMVLANGTRLLPGDRVLAIHDTAQPWLTFLPPGEFLPLDSSKIIISGEWEAPYVELSKHPEAESGAWSEPDRQSQRRPWLSQVTRINFRRAEFCYRDSSFWAKPIEWMVNGWFPLTKNEVLSSTLSFGPSTDSSRAQVLFDLATALRRGRRVIYDNQPPDSVQRYNAVRLYELSHKISSRRGYREMAANALLTLMTTDLERRDEAAALARLRRAVKQFAGVKSMFGRADAFATWQMMELAWRQKQTALTRSLARTIITKYPDEVGSYASRSVWFDVEAADRLLQTAAGDELQAGAAAEFLMKSASVAVRYRGYERLLHIRLQNSDRLGALVLARAALSLPHSAKWLVHAPLSDDRFMSPESHDFKVEFMDSLDVLLPRGELDTLYHSILAARDTTANWYALSWFLRGITQGKLPPQPELLKYAELARSSSEFTRVLLCSIDSGPILVVTPQCSSQIASAAAESRLRGRRVAGPNLSVGDTLTFLTLDDARLRFRTSRGTTGSVRVDDLPSVPLLTQMPAIILNRAVLYCDLTGDGVPDIGYDRDFVFDGRTLKLRRLDEPTPLSRIPFTENHAVGLFFASDTECALHHFEPPRVHPRDRAWKEFDLDEFRRLADSWPRTYSVGHGQYAVDFASYWTDSFAVVISHRHMALLSLGSGRTVWQRSFDRDYRLPGNALFLREGYATFEGDSLTFRDYQARRRWQVPAQPDWRLPWPVLSSDVRRPTAPRLAAGLVPVVTDSAVFFFSASDGEQRGGIQALGLKSTVLYDREHFYISDSLGSRVLKADGSPVVTLRLPYMTFPLWDKGSIVASYSRPLHLLLSSATAKRLSRLLEQN
jgi:hypothetical protein